MLSAKQGNCKYHFLKSFGMTRLGEMNPRSTDCEANALTTTPSRHNRGVVTASASQSIDLGFISPSRVIPKDFKKWYYLQFPCLALSIIGIVWRTSREACLLCPWARHLTDTSIFMWKIGGRAKQSTRRGGPV